MDPYKALASSSSVLLEKAARLIDELRLTGYPGQLVAAFDRMLSAPDAACAAKIAIVKALLATDAGAEAEAVYLRGLRHHQREGQVDAAGPLRGYCALGLLNLRHRDALVELTDLLADPEPAARVAGARGLASTGRDELALPLRLRLVAGDPSSVVLSECMIGLLRLDPSRSLSLVSRYLDDDSADVRDAGALALRESRHPGALAALRRAFDRQRDGESRRTILLAAGLLRGQDAVDWLLSVVENAAERDALGALQALRVHRRDAALSARLAALLATRGLPALHRDSTNTGAADRDDAAAPGPRPVRRRPPWVSCHAHLTRAPLPETVAMPEDRQPLSYERAPADPIPRWQFRLLFLLVLLNVVMTFHASYLPGATSAVKRWWAQYQDSRRVHALQQQAWNWSEPPQTVVWDDHPETAAALLAGVGHKPVNVPHEINGNYPWLVNWPAGAAATMPPFARQLFKPHFPWSADGLVQGTEDASVVYVHGLVSPGGTRRLVYVYLKGQTDLDGRMPVPPGRYSVPTEPFEASARRRLRLIAVPCVPAAGATLPQTLQKESTALTVAPQGSEWKFSWSYKPGPGGQPGTVRPAARDRFRFYAGQSDPSDPSRFTIDYEHNGRRGRIHGQLTDDGMVRLSPDAGTVTGEQWDPTLR